MNSFDALPAIVGYGVLAPQVSAPGELWDRLRQSPRAATTDPARFDNDDFHSPDPECEDATYGRGFMAVTGFDPHPVLGAEMASGTAPDDLTALWLRHTLLCALDEVTVRASDRVLFVLGYPLPGSLRLDESLTERAAGLRPAEQDDTRFLPFEIARTAAHGLLPEGTDTLVIDSACSSALYACDIGARALRADEADIALCAGAYAVTPRDCVAFAKARGMSPSMRLRAFDEAADGAVLGDAAGAVVLKTPERAAADQERVLAVVTATGTSSDGKGKAIYAPDQAGQYRAVRRALDSGALAPDDVDWVIAHGTGTPVGDRSELTSLNSAYAERATALPLVSNKSVFGHSCNASGAVSLAHALLALDNAAVPRQQHFRRLPELPAEVPSVAPLTGERAWPRRSGSPRTVAVSAFGFGGTDIHLLLSDRPGPSAPVPAPPDEVVLVGWDALLPGAPDTTALTEWLREGTAPGATAFGDPYPVPSPKTTGIPPVTAERIDRTQMMALECVQRYTERCGTPWERAAGFTGALTGHFGPTRAGVDYTHRCHLRQLRRRFADRGSAARHESAVRERIAPISLDTVAGIMPGCVAARVAKRWDLHGMTMAVEQGWDSTLAALSIAHGALAARELDFALLLGAHGNRLPEFGSLLAPYGVPGVLAEGVFLLVLARQEALGSTPGLARVTRLPAGVAPEEVPTVRCGPWAGRTYAGADGAVALLRAVVGPDPVAVVAPSPGGTGPLWSVARTA
ncbi:beta-ketoacyl synthase N-terminal-like domain-containing protein [Streptomyces sp. NPDC054796]